MSKNEHTEAAKVESTSGSICEEASTPESEAAQAAKEEGMSGNVCEETSAPEGEAAQAAMEEGMSGSVCEEASTPEGEAAQAAMDEGTSVKAANISTRKKNSERIFRLTLLGMMSAIIIIMSFTPLGYLKVGVIEITFLALPVAIGCALLGAKGGAVLGGLFGITSLIQAVSGLSAFGAALMAISPLYTILLCIVPRVLMGFLAGLLATLFKRKVHHMASGVAASLAAPLLNTILFMSGLILMFWSSDYIQGMASGMNIFAFVIAFVGVNGLVEAIVCLVVGTVISTVLLAVYGKTFGRKSIKA